MACALKGCWRKDLAGVRVEELEHQVELMTEMQAGNAAEILARTIGGRR